jgi:hypothetical protein
VPSCSLVVRANVSGGEGELPVSVFGEERKSRVSYLTVVYFDMLA